jgi:hypothetical protein
MFLMICFLINTSKNLYKFGYSAEKRVQWSKGFGHLLIGKIVLEFIFKEIKLCNK